MRLFIILAVLFTGFIGCKKNKEVIYTVSGLVSDPSFTQFASGVQVNLYQTDAGGQEYLAQSAATGSDGQYSFSIKREKIEGFRLTFTKNNYFSEERTFSLSDLDANTTNTFNLSINAKSWVRLVFKNTNANESVAISRTAGLTGCNECCSYSSFILSGITDTSFVCLNTANAVYSYSWIYTNGTSYYDKTITTVPLDTVDLTLNF